jgi:diguanylate cyclase (GGDEF)-like protein
MVSLGNYLLLQKWRFGSSLYRCQTTVMLSAALIIYVMYGFYLSGITILPSLKHLDWNPFVYSLWGLAAAVAIFRYRLFDLSPIARDAVIERLSDGVMVLDTQKRLVDANPEAQKLFGWQKPPMGQFDDKLMNNWINRVCLGAEAGSSKTETQFTRDGVNSYYESTTSILEDKHGHSIGYLVVIHDITRRKEIEKELQELSLVDDLTGLTNRRGFKILANQLINMAHRMRMDATLIYIDMDQLKWINDNLGHAIGDQALIDTGQILKNAFRSSDIIARVGGDEFVTLAIESAESPSDVMMMRLLQQLDSHNARLDQPYVLSLSIGTAHYEWKRPRTLEDLLDEADKAMYADKQAKRGHLDIESGIQVKLG